jgi:hypothetical protein
MVLFFSRPADFFKALQLTVMPIEKLNHDSIRTQNVKVSRKFYTDVMRLHEGFRPPFDFSGLWMHCDLPYPQTNGVVHNIGVDPDNLEGLKAYLGEKELSSLQVTGTLDHMTFTATRLAKMRQTLKTQTIPFRERTIPSLELHPVFLKIPTKLPSNLIILRSKPPSPFK